MHVNFMHGAPLVMVRTAVTEPDCREIDSRKLKRPNGGIEYYLSKRLTEPDLSDLSNGRPEPTDTASDSESRLGQL